MQPVPLGLFFSVILQVTLLQRTALCCGALESTQMRQVGLAWLLTCTAVWEKQCQTVAFVKAQLNCLSLLHRGTEAVAGQP